MTVESPLCFGQLSVWRSVQDLPPERAYEANVGVVVMLVGEEDPARALAAVRQLAVTTTGLRTSFRQQGTDLVQLEHPDASPAVDIIDVSCNDRDELERLRQEMHSDAFILTPGSPPWRATLMVRDGANVALALTLHHLIADGWVLSAIERTLTSILAGEPTEVLTGPRELASRQSTPAWRQRQALTFQNWSEMMNEAGLPFATEHELVVGRTQLHALTVDLGLPTAVIQRWSRDHDLFLSSTMLTLALLIQAVLHDRLQVSASLMSSNRFDPCLERTFTSLNQLTPISLHIDRSETLGDLARRVQDLSSEAYVLSCYDVDAMQRELDLTRNPVLMDYWFNFVAQPPELDNDEPAARLDVMTWALAPKLDGPRFLLFIDGGDFLQLTFRTSFALHPKARIERVFLRLGETIRAIVDGSDLPVADVLGRLRN